MHPTIVALATPPGIGAIGVVRLSGPEALTIAEALAPGAALLSQPTHTLHFRKILWQDTLLDEAVISLYRAPSSYTGEDVVEISSHGSPYILQQLMAACVSLGAQLAQPGEFTRRAFLNGKMDLTQAEAVADVIASESAASHRAAIHQLRGGFRQELQQMRERLIHFTALIELELDFSQEDVTFADRVELRALVTTLHHQVTALIQSFQYGNAVRKGIAAAIVGKPNAGKSTFLNAVLNEERAIVSPIPGTTRDTIEEVVTIHGILFRFIDTAGIRSHTADSIEQQGIARSLQKAASADIIIHLIDGTDPEATTTDLSAEPVVLINKDDLLTPEARSAWRLQFPKALFITARDKQGVPEALQLLANRVLQQQPFSEATIVTNARHHSILRHIQQDLDHILDGLNNNLTGDLLSHHIRQALHYIGELTGTVHVDRDILGAIFGKFCIGK